MVLLQELIFEGQLQRIVFFQLGVFKLIEPSNRQAVGRAATESQWQDYPQTRMCNRCVPSCEGSWL